MMTVWKSDAWSLNPIRPGHRGRKEPLGTRFHQEMQSAGICKVRARARNKKRFISLLTLIKIF